MAAARAFGLDFVPVTREPYDLVLAADALEDPAHGPAVGAARRPGLPRRVEALGGYDTAEMGRRIR